MISGKDGAGKFNLYLTARLLSRVAMCVSCDTDIVLTLCAVAVVPLLSRELERILKQKLLNFMTYKHYERNILFYHADPL